ncbi:hypothetical protein Bhyg_07730, partial [Pseudolycoriella hygida]
TWTKCTVKIEAIKYIPCFVKVTLTPHKNDEKSDIVIKINIPGLGVQLASSRSKLYSYGLFWTHHRKNCRLFFAFDSTANLERHINWIQNSISNLEIHRREMLESRRASRISKVDENVSLNSSTDEGRCNDTQDIKDINDILGPLPKLPDSNINWSRRISTASEIYEEIGDGNHRNGNRKSSRTSIASGIYEVMTSPLISTEESAYIHEEMPPPLPPPRQRLYTQSEINRTYTNPESISSKKRKRNIFETVFSRNKVRKSPKPKEQSAKLESPVIELIRSHRMSYSSPDLSKAEVTNYINEFENDLMARSSATEFSIRNEHSFLNSTTSSEKGIFDDERNISENILSNFNISCNESAVNLVGSNLIEIEPTEKVSVAMIIDDASGYCQMAPIIRGDLALSQVSAPELPPTSPLVDSSARRLPVEMTKAITFCRDYGMEASLQNFENLTISKENSQRLRKDTKVLSSPNSMKKSTDLADQQASLQTSKHSSSFDDKYPSYYPNDVTPSKDYRKNNESNYLAGKEEYVPERTENVYITTPRHGSNPSTKKSKESSKLVVLSPTNPLVSCKSSQLSTPSTKLSIADSTSCASPLLYHKYATVAPSKVKDTASCKKNIEITSSTKRFSSLPRFKKIDFSPLKLKLNSVLQRQNNDQITIINVKKNFADSLETL